MKMAQMKNVMKLKCVKNPSSVSVCIRSVHGIVLVYSMYRFECNQNNFWTIGRCDNGTEGLFLSWLKQDGTKEQKSADTHTCSHTSHRMWKSERERKEESKANIQQRVLTKTATSTVVVVVVVVIVILLFAALTVFLSLLLFVFFFVAAAAAATTATHMILWVSFTHYDARQACMHNTHTTTHECRAYTRETIYGRILHRIQLKWVNAMKSHFSLTLQ